MAVNTKTEIIIVAGLSGSGKSTFTEKHLLPGIRSRGLDLNKDVDIKYFEQADDDISLSTKPVCIVHFNTHVDSDRYSVCLLYTSPSPRDQRGSRMPSSA